MDDWRDYKLTKNELGSARVRELPDMMPAKLSDFFTWFGSDLYSNIHTTSLTKSAFPWPPSFLLMGISYLEAPMDRSEWLRSGGGGGGGLRLRMGQTPKRIHCRAADVGRTSLGRNAKMPFEQLHASPFDSFLAKNMSKLAKLFRSLYWWCLNPTNLGMVELLPCAHCSKNAFTEMSWLPTNASFLLLKSSIHKITPVSRRKHHQRHIGSINFPLPPQRGRGERTIASLSLSGEAVRN